MGGKRTRKGQHLLFYAACVASLLLFSGCSHLSLSWLGNQQFDKANALLAEGDFEASLKENERVYRESPERFGAQAHFNRALIYAHPENPKADYEKALESFGVVLERFPESPLRESARIWVLTIRRITGKEEEIRVLGQRLHQLKEALETKEKSMALLREEGERIQMEEEKSRNEAKRLQEEIRTLEVRILDLEGQMERLKRVDLGIAEKKRKALR